MTFEDKALAAKEAELTAAQKSLTSATREMRAYWQSEIERIEARLLVWRKRAAKVRSEAANS